jgi:hypothetical protein
MQALTSRVDAQGVVGSDDTNASICWTTSRGLFGIQEHEMNVAHSQGAIGEGR